MWLLPYCPVSVAHRVFLRFLCNRVLGLSYVQLQEAPLVMTGLQRSLENLFGEACRFVSLFFIPILFGGRWLLEGKGKVLVYLKSFPILFGRQPWCTWQTRCWRLVPDTDFKCATWQISILSCNIQFFPFHKAQLATFVIIVAFPRNSRILKHPFQR